MDNLYVLYSIEPQGNIGRFLGVFDDKDKALEMAREWRPDPDENVIACVVESCQLNCLFLASGTLDVWIKA